MRLRRLVVTTLLTLLVTCRNAALTPLAVAAAATNVAPIRYPDDLLTKSQPTTVVTAAGDPALEKTYWQKCVCRSQTLTKACMSSKDNAVQFGTPLDTKFDGTLEADLARWGYIERNKEANEKHCDLFEMTLEGVLEGLELGGHNECFWFQHNRGEKEPLPGVSDWVPVDQQTYQNTYAKAIMAANADDGVIYFIYRKSAVSGAAEAWGVKVPPVDQLPELRQMSDMAWGMWRRVHPSEAGFSNIKYSVVAQVVNKETLGLIADVHKSEESQAGQARVDQVHEWPGVIWDIESPEGVAMLGSPNGLAIGYFLSQHKA
ncbi:hypothetical protein E8E12_010379 [Didymella heteroderae]|uniref:Uncharacterized protein n=1 Tax=Didymella heteroderae TaxID=1769908 RepID=A0A9P4WZK2_9PLEO|nr:hypothetical protein E8E12_010379 [Didymella heteroderae]